MSLQLGNVNSFERWQNSPQNYQNYVNGQKNENFQILDWEGIKAENPGNEIAKYTEQLTEFSQQYISQFDTNGDNKLDIDEYMAFNKNAYQEMFGEDLDISQKEIKESLKESFETLSTLNPEDAEGKFIDEKEYASFLALADNMDEESIDGKVTYENVQELPMYNNFKEVVSDFFSYFFGE